MKKLTETQQNIIRLVWPLYSAQKLADIFKVSNTTILNATGARVSRGRRHPKLTDTEVLAIRARARTEPHAVLGREYKLDRSCIRRIVNGETYPHLPLVQQLSKLEKCRLLHLQRKQQHVPV